MKVQNKTTQLKDKDGLNITYAFLITVVVNVPTKAGVTIKEMKRDISIVTKFENVEVDAEVEVTKEELAHIISMAENHRWPQTHVELVQFVDYLTELK